MNDYKFVNGQTHFLKYLFKKTHVNNAKQAYDKKIINFFGNNIRRALDNYKLNTSPRLYAPREFIITLMNN
jgi:hypothetical protein